MFVSALALAHISVYTLGGQSTRPRLGVVHKNAVRNDSFRVYYRQRRELLREERMEEEEGRNKGR